MLLAYAANINRVKTAHPLLYLYIQMITFTSFMYAWSLCLNDQDCQIPTSLYRYSITTLCIQNIDWLVFNANFSSISATLYIEIKSQVTEQCSKSWTNVRYEWVTDVSCHSVSSDLSLRFFKVSINQKQKLPKTAMFFCIKTKEEFL